jgi:hypothetical protein
MKGIWLKALEGSCFPMRYRGSTRMPIGNLDGNGYFPQPPVTLKTKPAFVGDIISMRVSFNAGSKRL